MVITLVRNINLRFPQFFVGQSLNQQLEQTAILLEETGRSPKQVIVDLGYRGLDQDNTAM